jgi:hypothetical protein
MLIKSRYRLEIQEGERGRLSEVRAIKLDNTPLSAEEIEDLENEFDRLFPNETYSLTYRTSPAEDNTSLHVYVNITEQERRTRDIPRGAGAYVVPIGEIAERLQGW